MATDAAGDERGLIERVQRGDRDAFGTVAQRHMRCAFTVAYRILGNREDAEDLVQEAFLVALDRIDTFELGRPFVPWFLRIVTNRGLNARKSRALRETDALPEQVATAAPSPQRVTEEAEARERLHRAMTRLSERQRLVVQLFELDGFATPEIAEMLEIAEGTVRWTLHEARKALRAALASPHRKGQGHG